MCGKKSIAEHFREAANHLAHASEIYVTAQHAAFAYATLFSWTLLRYHRQCHLLDNAGGFALRQSELAGPLDTTLAISFEPYQPSVVQAAKAHADRGGTVISVTDSPLSPLARYSNILLEVPRREFRTRPIISPPPHALSKASPWQLANPCLARPKADRDQWRERLSHSSPCQQYGVI